MSATNRTVVATLILDGVDGIERGFSRAGQAALSYGKTASSAGGKALGWVDKHSATIDKAATGLLTFGTVGVAALGGLTWAAMDWGSAWAGVTKTVDGTQEQMGQLEAGLRQMSKELPATHTEIAAVAEAAGQLGVETDSILGFTRTMLDLGEATNMSADEAATSLARLMNIMGTSQGDVNRLGSTVVALGNNLATTEGEIVAMSMRLAGVGSQMGLSEDAVMSIAGAMSSVGIEAEAGGTAMSMSMKKIDAAVREGGDKLALLAQASGMSADEFSASWRDNAGLTIASFVEGLGGMIASGADANSTLKELGMTGIRESDSLLRLAGATKAAGTEQDLLRDSLALGSQAWDENTALSNEAAQRYETTAAKMQMAINGIKDEAITMGQMLLPVVNDALGALSSLMSGFSSLDEGTKRFIVTFGGVAAVAALAVGGLLKLITTAAATRGALIALGISARGAMTALGLIGVALTVAAIPLNIWMKNQQTAKERADALTQAIRQQGGVMGELSRAAMTSALEDDGALRVAQELGLSLDKVVDAALGSKKATAEMNAELAAGVAAIDERIAAHQAEIDIIDKKMTTGSETDAETERYRELQLALGELNAERGEWISGQASMESVTTSQSGKTAEAAEKALRLQEAMGEVGEASTDAASGIDASTEASLRDAESKQREALSAQEAAEAIRDLLTAVQAHGNELLALSGSEIAVAKATADMTKHMKDAKTGLDLGTEAGVKNREALDALARPSMALIATMYEQGKSAEEIAAATAEARAEWVKARTVMAGTAEGAEELADAYFGIPGHVATWLAAEGLEVAEADAARWEATLRDIPEAEQTLFLAELDGASVAQVEDAFDRLERARSMNISVSYVTTNLPPAARDRIDQRLYSSANGNLFEFYGNGGMRRENHIAQHAPAGAWRVWAEPETEGESYIPHARSKRPRSLQIWAETGRILGVQGFANGAVLNPPSVIHNNNQRGPVTLNASFPSVQGAADAEAFTRSFSAILEQQGL